MSSGWIAAIIATAGSTTGYRYDDVAFGIGRPLPVTVISERDLSWPAFKAGGSVLTVS
jgi:dTDP-4-dehydrorhamnose 3,5-epimerase